MIWNQWRVVALRGKRADINMGETFVRAETEEKARQIGKSVLRTRIRGKFTVYATRYYPWKDWNFVGFLRPVKDTSENSAP